MGVRSKGGTCSNDHDHGVGHELLHFPGVDIDSAGTLEATFDVPALLESAWLESALFES